MTSRSRLTATMDALAKKRQRDFDEHNKWNNQIQYYKNWDRYNNQYQNWTSSEYYSTSLNQYNTKKKQLQKSELLEVRREKLRKLYFDEEKDYELEMQSSPRYIRHSKFNQTPVEVLKDINIGLKRFEDDKQRHEAEIKLYHHWRQENPIVKDYEMNQGKAGLKLAWLDQQIEKRMEQEKLEVETRKLIEERNIRIKEDQELDRLELQEKDAREKEQISQLELQMRHFKLKDVEAERLKREEYETISKKLEIEDLLQKQAQDKQLRRTKEVALFNINQSKMKLRKKAADVEQQLKKEQLIIEEILASKTAEEIQDEIKRNQIKNSITSFLNYVREQQQLEEQRKKYIAFIFDSEAKNLWDKQERLWREEQDARDKLFTDVLSGLKVQIQEKLNRNLDAQKELLQEREDMLQNIEESNKQMRVTKEEMIQKKIDRKFELDKQIYDKQLIEKETKMIEEKKKLEELESIRKEEEKLKHELLQMQRRQYPQQRHNRRIIW